MQPANSENSASVPIVWAVIALSVLGLIVTAFEAGSGENISWTSWALPVLIAVNMWTAVYGPRHLSRRNMSLLTGLSLTVAVAIFIAMLA